jgi:hypothetical protein
MLELASAAISEVAARWVPSIRRRFNHILNRSARVILLALGYSHSKALTWHGEGNEDRQAVVTRNGFATERQSIGRHFDDVADVGRILFHNSTITGC